FKPEVEAVEQGEKLCERRGLPCNRDILMRQGDLAGDEAHKIAACERYGRCRFILALRIKMENRILDPDKEMLARIGEAKIDREFPRASFKPVEAHGERIQQLLCG